MEWQMPHCQPLKTNVFLGGTGGEGVVNGGEIGGPDCKQGVGRQASFILTPEFEMWDPL